MAMLDNGLACVGSIVVVWYHLELVVGLIHKASPSQGIGSTGLL